MPLALLIIKLLLQKPALDVFSHLFFFRTETEYVYRKLLLRNMHSCVICMYKKTTYIYIYIYCYFIRFVHGMLRLFSLCTLYMNHFVVDSLQRVLAKDRAIFKNTCVTVKYA